MTYTTQLLENESGIQYQGVKDKSGSTSTYPITALMMGFFKRGRFDKPMTITNENIRAQLGYEQKNTYYVAVQDVLNSGVPSVQVLRLGVDGSADHAYISFPPLDWYQEVSINGQTFHSENHENFRDFLQENGLELYNTNDSLGCWQLYRFQNMTNKPLNITLDKANLYGFGLMILDPQENKTIKGVVTNLENLDFPFEQGFNNVQFTLSPDKTFLEFPANAVIFSKGGGYGFFKKNSIGEDYLYKFYVNDQIIINSKTGNDYFLFSNENDVEQLSNELKDVGVMNAYVFEPEVDTMVFWSNIGLHKKMKFSLLGNIDSYAKSYANDIARYSNSLSIINTATEFSLEGYIYDPLNLENAE